MQEPRRSLNHAIATYCAAVFMVLALLVCISSALSTRLALYRQCQQQMTDIVDYIDEHIDHDDLARCVARKQESAKFRELKALMDDVYTHHHIGYLYIITTIETAAGNGELDMMNVICALSPQDYAEGEGELYVLGGTGYGHYTQKTLAQLREIQAAGEPTFVYLQSSFGEDYTALLPLKDSAGTPFALLCLDMPTVFIRNRLLNDVALHLLVVVALGVAAVIGSYLWMRTRVTDPIHALERSVIAYAQTVHEQADPKQFVFDKPDIHTGDEMESLAQAMDQMAVDLQAYALGLAQAQKEVAQQRLAVENKQRELEKTNSEIEEKREELRLAQEQLDKMGVVAYQDPLTKVKNKTAYQAAWRRLQRLIVGHAAEFGIVMIDINYLKRINDTYGHERGDDYIVGTCRQVCTVYAHSPVYRIGGDEFVVILEGEDYERRDELLGILRERLAACSGNEQLRPWERYSAAVGMAIYQWGDFTVDNVFKRADTLMYEDKVRQKAERTE